MKDEELHRIADELGCTIDDLKEMGERCERAMHEFTEIIAKSEAGTVTCPACQGDADFRREGNGYNVECDCGFKGAGQVPKSAIRHTKH